MSKIRWVIIIALIMLAAGWSVHSQDKLPSLKEQIKECREVKKDIKKSLEKEINEIKFIIKRGEDSAKEFEEISKRYSDLRKAGGTDNKMEDRVKALNKLQLEKERANGVLAHYNDLLKKTDEELQALEKKEADLTEKAVRTNEIKGIGVITLRDDYLPLDMGMIISATKYTVIAGKKLLIDYQKEKHAFREYKVYKISRNCKCEAEHVYIDEVKKADLPDKYEKKEVMGFLAPYTLDKRVFEIEHYVGAMPTSGAEVFIVLDSKNGLTALRNSEYVWRKFTLGLIISDKSLWGATTYYCYALKIDSGGSSKEIEEAIKLRKEMDEKGPPK